jgi:glycosyltransferase involved in cell wall biosynthesis
MKKLLYIGDYSNTGFGQVSKGLLRGLSAMGKYQILQVGINYVKGSVHGENWDIIPAAEYKVRNNRLVTNDPYGYSRIDSIVEKFDPDIIFLNNDYTIARNYMLDKNGNEKPFAKHRAKKVLYAPVDSEPVPKGFAQIAKMWDLNIAYSDWQRQLMAEHDPILGFMPILYHGVDHSIYKPMDKQQAKLDLIELMVEKIGEESRHDVEDRILDNFLVYFVGTNQFRKDLPCLFRAFALFHEQVPESVLIPHTSNIPSGPNGWVLKNLQVLTEVKNAIIMNNANIFSEEEMNIFYNAADVLAYPTRGEGFGLPSLEAMATKTPVIATAFGPQLELHNRGRGYFIEVANVIPGDVTAWSYFALPDHRSLFKQLMFVHSEKQDVAETVERAYEFSKKFSWEDSAKKLDSILSKLPEGEADASFVQDDETNNDTGEDA